MGIFDDMKQKAADTMNNDELMDKAQKMADEKGISLEAAKEHLMNKKSEE